MNQRTSNRPKSIQDLSEAKLKLISEIVTNELPPDSIFIGLVFDASGTRTMTSLTLRDTVEVLREMAGLIEAKITAEAVGTDVVAT